MTRVRTHLELSGEVVVDANVAHDGLGVGNDPAHQHGPQRHLIRLEPGQALQATVTPLVRRPRKFGVPVKPNPAHTRH